MASLYGPEMLTMPSGRQIAYEQFGHPRGEPVMFFHGMPFSRLITPPTSPDLGVRVISLDRPGYGLSDVQPGRKLLDYCDDVRAVADHLGLLRFAVAGVSAGGAYALACARDLGDRVTRAVVVAGVAHPDAVAARGPGGTPPAFTRAIETGDYSQVINMFEMYRRAALGNGQMFLDRLTSSLPLVDQEILSAHSAHVLSGMVDALYKTAEGWATDEVLMLARWGFRLQDVTAPVSLLHGEDDSIVTIGPAAFQASLIPGCRTIYYPGEAHWFFLERWNEILREAVSRKEMVH
jgi:pimeloyl-ACP methyl ester carboxylesterase